MTDTGRAAGGSLLAEVSYFLQRYVVLSDAQAIAAALWVLHTHAFEAAQASPYLAVVSPEKRCGKTRLLRVLSLLVHNSWRVITPTAAVVFRKIERDRPTVLLDEIDAIFGHGKGSSDYEPLRAVLNAGNEPDTYVPRCDGPNRDQLREFSVYCPKAFAGIGRLPDTVDDRSIRIAIKRKAPGEVVQRFRKRDVAEEAEELQRHSEQWAATYLEALEAARPELPRELDDRAAESWEPLLAIADLVGDDWPRLARVAAVELSAGKADDDDSFGVQLLADAKRVLKRADRIATADLLDGLHKLEEGPWADWYGKPLSSRTLARLLKPYGVRSKTIRDGGDTFKGYERQQFVDAWARYLPDLSVTSVTSALQSQNGAVSHPSQHPRVTDSKTPVNPHGNGNVTLVTDNGAGKRCPTCDSELWPDEDGDGYCIDCGHVPRAARVVP